MSTNNEAKKLVEKAKTLSRTELARTMKLSENLTELNSRTMIKYLKNLKMSLIL